MSGLTLLELIVKINISQPLQQLNPSKIKRLLVRMGLAGIVSPTWRRLISVLVDRGGVRHA
jgi:hypothetical protein